MSGDNVIKDPMCSCDAASSLSITIYISPRDNTWERLFSYTSVFVLLLKRDSITDKVNY